MTDVVFAAVIAGELVDDPVLSYAADYAFFEDLPLGAGLAVAAAAPLDRPLLAGEGRPSSELVGFLCFGAGVFLGGVLVAGALLLGASPSGASAAAAVAVSALFFLGLALSAAVNDLLGLVLAAGLVVLAGAGASSSSS